MKKITLLLTLFLYLSTTVGFSLTVHHCGGKNSFQLFGLNINKHCKCDHEKENHSTKCCHDKLVILKTNKNDKNTNKSFTLKFHSNKLVAFLPYQIATAFTTNNFPLPTFVSESPHGHSPPIYILHRSFLI
ncbi:MAG: hypothetical protein RJA07_1526 [Bacteroidota bacterium]